LIIAPDHAAHCQGVNVLVNIKYVSKIFITGTEMQKSEQANKQTKCTFNSFL